MNLRKLFVEVFQVQADEVITLIVDLPISQDNSNWEWRREFADKLHYELSDHNVKLASYSATYANNADLPETCVLDGKKISFAKLMSESDIVIALTEYSATAPLHKYAKKYGLRVASMPGFNEKMMPALELDYKDVAAKVKKLYDAFDGAESAEVAFEADGKEYKLFLDLRNRTPKKDDGNCREKGTVINLPSGEAFIAPYDGKDSKSKGFLPINQDGKIRIYTVDKNKITACDDPKDSLIVRIKEDPAVGNIAELAFGVLGSYGIKPCGRVLLDEKLGFHIALGRSDHFGGLTGPYKFRKKENVWHQDFVYIEEMQPGVSVKEVKLIKGNFGKIVIKNNKYNI
ncbi:hypothetical protein JXC34_01215 [Candidatus Woesearchaeota archaeon]|nr:hypothetical protein [Candidatus Woesearchaeota archaeon]